jgi:hypothetical protein
MKENFLPSDWKEIVWRWNFSLREWKYFLFLKDPRKTFCMVPSGGNIVSPASPIRRDKSFLPKAITRSTGIG